ncbi:MAG: alpha/beta fold hydrolase [Candidatus Micropelagos thuwalensis]
MASTKTQVPKSDIDLLSDETPKALPPIGPPITHCNIPKENPSLTADIRYKGTSPPPCSANMHGEVEILKSGVEATHWFVEANGITWHFVTAGNAKNQPVLFLHGLPESWFAFHNQMSALSEDYYVIAFDSLGYGQSDKRLNIDYRNTSLASNFTALLDTIGIHKFNIVAHDRGAVLVDYLTEFDGMQDRILTYVRMQQSANEPHGEPKPPHEMFASPMGVKLFQSEGALFPYHKSSGFVREDIPMDEFERTLHEFTYEGVAEAVSQYFKTTNFEIELEDRHNRLFKTMSMPILFLQGRYDPGQHPSEYENTPDFVANGQVQFLEASHFPHMETPDLVTDAIREFLTTAHFNTL